MKFTTFLFVAISLLILNASAASKEIRCVRLDSLDLETLPEVKHLSIVKKNDYFESIVRFPESGTTSCYAQPGNNGTFECIRPSGSSTTPDELAFTIRTLSVENKRALHNYDNAFILQLEPEGDTQVATFSCRVVK